MGGWTRDRQPVFGKGVCRLKNARPWHVAAVVVLVGLAKVQGSSVASDSGFHWTPAKVVLAIFLFLAAGLCEIGGGWLVWQVLSPRLLLLLRAHILEGVRNGNFLLAGIAAVLTQACTG